VLFASARDRYIAGLTAFRAMEDHWTTAVRIEGQPVDEGRLPDAGS